MGSDRMHQQVPRALTDVMVRSLSILFHGSWYLGLVPEAEGKQMPPPSSKRSGKRKAGRTTGQSATSWSPGK